MLEMENKKGKGDLIPKLGRMLVATGGDFTRVRAYGIHVGFQNETAMYFAKKELWRETTVSFQKAIVDEACKSEKWIVIWVKEGNSLTRFDPQTVELKGWLNWRGEEEMINVDVSHWKRVSLFLQKKIDREQLQLTLASHD